MRFSFLHAADLHLDSPLKGLESYPDAPTEQIRSATRRALDNLVDLAIQEKVFFVLLVGDIFDGSWRDFNTALFFAQRMGQLRDAGIKVFLVTGNHDAASTIEKNLRPPDNVHVLSKTAPETFHLKELGVYIHGQGYPQRKVDEDLALGFPLAKPGSLNIGLLHTALNGRPGHEPYAPTSTDVLTSKGYDYWALGHIHQREVISRDPWIVFPGCIQGRHIKEEGPKGCTLVLVEDGQIMEASPQELDVLRWSRCRVDLTECDCEEHVWLAVRSSLETALDAADGRPVAVRMEFIGQTVLHNWLHEKQKILQEECRTMAAGLGDIWMEKIQLNTQSLLSPESRVEFDSPLVGLMQSIEGLSLSTSSCLQDSELAGMLSKLPSEIQAGEEAFDLNNPEQLRQIQDEVKDLLLTRMLRKGVQS